MKLLDNESRIYPNALSEEIVELGLFVREFLTERAIFDSFGLEFLREQGILSVTQWKDIQSRSIQDDLDDLDESFNLSPGSENETSNETFEGEHLLDPETQSRLRSAIRWGDVAAIETLLSQKIGLADPDTLICVLMSDDLAIFRSFLIHGAIADGDTPDHFNGPLYTAAEHGCFHRFRRSGPLFAVAKCGLLEAVETLLQHGLNVEGNAETYSDPWNLILSPLMLSPLYAAASCGYLEIVEYLHKHGASIGQAQHNCPLMEAARNGHLTVVQYLHQHRASNNGGLLNQLLTEAAKNDHLTVVQYLHEQGAPLRRSKYLQWYGHPLSHAAKNGHLAVVQYLIERGAEIYGCGHNGPLSTAASNGHLAVVQCLHQHGANINGTKYNFRDSPLAIRVVNQSTRLQY
jgi:Ankyrin repeats (3 copies)/Ankyrin repeats (many copies)